MKSHGSGSDAISYRHVPVMPVEVLHYLNCRPGNTYVDCTLGGSGHARLILESILPDGKLIGIDQDEAAIKNGQKVLAPFLPNARLFHRNFVHLREILTETGIGTIDGILLDLGASQYQFDASGRGFSFRRDEPLDMRMDTRTDTTAEAIVNQQPERDLARLLIQYGEERYAKRIARHIGRERAINPITSSLRLADIVCRAIPKRHHTRRHIHPATRVFMALRIAVNRELERLGSFMGTVADLLSPGGRLCVLSFHSLEDRIVKRQLKLLEKGCDCPPDFPKCECGKKGVVRSLTKKALRPKEAEVSINPMARSARLRAVERLGDE